MGWEGNHQGVVACLGGNFLVQNGIFKSYGFGIYTGSATTWTDADGYLPALITSFVHGPAKVTITEFADKVALAGHPTVLLYARVHVANPTDQSVTAAPDPSAALVPLHTATECGPPARSGQSRLRDRRRQVRPIIPLAHVGRDGAGRQLRWALCTHEEFLELPVGADCEHLDSEPRPANAYRAGFIDTQIARSGNELHTGVNGYQSQFSHDVIGILTNLFTQGDDQDAHALLTQAGSVVGTAKTPTQYVDGLWEYPIPWAVYS